MSNQFLDGVRQAFPEYSPYSDEELAPALDKMLRGPNRVALVQKLKAKFPEYQQFSDNEMLGASLKFMVGTPGTLSALAAQRQAAIEKEKTDPTGGASWWERTKRVAGEAAGRFNTAAEQFGHNVTSIQNPIENIKSAMTMGQAPMDVATSPVQAGVESAIVSGHPEYEEAGRIGGELAKNVVQVVGQTVLGAKLQPKAESPRVVQTEQGPIKIPVGEEPTLVDPDTGKVMEGNAPASPEAQAALNQDLASKGVDPNDPKAVFDNHMQESGINVPSKVTVGETPVSTSQLGEDGIPDVQLADEAPASAVHEAEHMKADIQGTEQPPEDNDEILGAYRDRLPTAQRMRNKQTPPDRPILEPGTNAGRVDIPPTTSPIQGPKELSQVSQEAPPPGVSEPWIGEQGGPAGSGKWKPGTPEKPLPDTPDPISPKEAQERGMFYRAADNITRFWQASMASLSGARIHVTGDLRLMSYALSKIGSRLITGEGNAFEGFDMLAKVYSRGDVKDVMGGLEKLYPEQIGKFNAGGTFDPGGNKYANMIGSVNRIAHLLPKQAAATVRLASKLEARGLDLYDLAQNGGLGQITKDELADALSFGNKIGYTWTPKSGTIAQRILGAFQNPVGRLFSLFPRMTANTMRTMWEFSPHQIVKVLGRDGKMGILTGDPDRAVEAVNGVLGLGALYVGYKMQESNPKFLTVHLTDKTSLNVGHIIPGMGQVYALGATAYRLSHVAPGDENTGSDAIVDLMKSVAGIPSIGATIIGDAIKGELFRTGGVQREAGRAVGALSQPFQALTDAISIIDESQRNQKDTSGSLAGPLVSHVPYARDVLPDQASPTRSGIQQNNPSAHLIGAPLEEASTPVEDELKRNGIHVPWYPLQKSDENLKFRQEMGPEVEKQIGAKINDPEYQTFGPARKRYELQKIVDSIKGGEKKKAAVETGNTAELVPKAKAAIAAEVK